MCFYEKGLVSKHTSAREFYEVRYRRLPSNHRTTVLGVALADALFQVGDFCFRLLDGTMSAIKRIGQINFKSGLGRQPSAS